MTLGDARVRRRVTDNLASVDISHSRSSLSQAKSLSGYVEYGTSSSISSRTR
jgi:hypothetical protein